MRQGRIWHGDLEDLDSLRRGVDAADGVIHMGFIHDFARFKAVCEVDRLVIETLGSALAGTNWPLIITSGTALVSPGRVATEENTSVFSPDDFPRVASEAAAQALEVSGVRVAAVRLSPSIHGDGDHGFIPMLTALAREKGVSAYVGEGNNRWTAVHRLDAASLFRLAREKATSGARYHGVADEGVAFRDIAAVIGKRSNVPVVAQSPQVVSCLLQVDIAGRQCVV